MTQSYITVDGSLADSILEYASVLDLYNKDLNYTSKIESFIITNDEQDDQDDEEEELQFNDDIYKEIVESYQYLTNIPDRDLEGLINLAVYILTFNNDFEKLVIDFFGSLFEKFELNNSDLKITKNKKATLKITSIISNLSNIFNLQINGDNFPFKNFILGEILKLIEILGNGEILLPIISNLESWLTNDINQQPSEIQEETRSILLKISKLIKPYDELSSLNVFKISITKIPNVSSDLINQFIIANLNSNKALDLSKILTEEVIIANHESSQNHLKFLQNYLNFTTQDFQKSIDEYSSLSEIDFKLVLTKNQYLNLCKIASTTSTISYSQISSDLLIPENQVEIFLINAIKTGIIQGKLSQINSNFQVYKVNLILKTIELNDWLEIKSLLLDWRSKLSNVKSLIDQASKKKLVK
ncbi:hypothetical protein BN7_2520 [Wickerhamomyces ciferrii]|uniref:PCI domain-containing protein n=1 Tax=Wickerhamomyces ciferrii (strain ATCC 14091 / BCRC 22168 / CBS 111 / JCM 3599 / NBRC 0793 / NRRL Y-1031 F-60-10) TaxID=1206466 RepID=K0KNK0_WICCF|nr:uncharacterized protein BN7_2520 [Wickerhamomyces ciferrii]CCH42974.1 hypothetical protein BN7_2520 [Wickerhamomyces ciferrii]